MSTQFRVDRTDGPTPCGTNSIVYIGASPKAAHKAYHATNPGLDTWNQPNPKYGVLLSRWQGRWYARMAFKLAGA